MKKVNLLLLVCLFLIGGKDFLGGAGEKENLKVGYGWSTKDEVEAAVKEAVSKMKMQLGKTEPVYVLLFATVGYDSQRLLSEVRKMLPQETQIYGGTSCLGVLTKDGFHVGKVGSLAVLGVSSSPELIFGVGGAELKKYSSPQQAGEAAIRKAIKQAGRKEGEKPQLILMTASPGKEEKILLGIEKVVGRKVPVIGGSAADNDISEKWRVFANQKVYAEGVALTAIYSQLKIGWDFQSGYLRTEKQGEITEAKGRVIYKIDHRPAAEVYNEWVYRELDDVLKTGGKILTRTTFHPLAKVIRGKGGETYYLSIHPLSFNLPEKSLTVFADMESGEGISLLHGTWELLLNRARITTMNARIRGEISPEEIKFGLFTFCAGTMLAIPRDEMPKMVPLIIDGLGKTAPFIGTFTFGEQGYLPGIGSRHGNLVNSMIIFSKVKK